MKHTTQSSNGHQPPELEAVRREASTVLGDIQGGSLGKAVAARREKAILAHKQQARAGNWLLRALSAISVDDLAYNVEALMRGLGDVLRTFVVTFFIRVGLPLSPFILWLVEYLSSVAAMRLNDDQIGGHTVLYDIAPYLAFGLVSAYFILLFNRAEEYQERATVRYRWSLRLALRNLGYRIGFGKGWQPQERPAQTHAQLLQRMATLLMLVIAALGTVGRLGALLKVAPDVTAPATEATTSAYIDPHTLGWLVIILTGPVLSIALLWVTERLIMYLGGKEAGAAKRRTHIARRRAALAHYSPAELAAADQAELLYLMGRIAAKTPSSPRLSDGSTPSLPASTQPPLTSQDDQETQEVPAVAQTTRD